MDRCTVISRSATGTIKFTREEINQARQNSLSDFSFPTTNFSRHIWNAAIVPTFPRNGLEPMAWTESKDRAAPSTECVPFRAETRTLIRGCIFTYSCSARRISFEMNLKTTDFKRNSSGRTRIYEYPPRIELVPNPMRGFNFVPSRSDLMLIFLSGNQPCVETSLHLPGPPPPPPPPPAGSVPPMQSRSEQLYLM